MGEADSIVLMVIGAFGLIILHSIDSKLQRVLDEVAKSNRIGSPATLTPQSGEPPPTA